MRRVDCCILDGCVEVLDDEGFGPVSDMQGALNPRTLEGLPPVNDDGDARTTVLDHGGGFR